MFSSDSVAKFEKRGRKFKARQPASPLEVLFDKSSNGLAWFWCVFYMFFLWGDFSFSKNKYGVQNSLGSLKS